MWIRSRCVHLEEIRVPRIRGARVQLDTGTSGSYAKDGDERGQRRSQNYSRTS